MDLARLRTVPLLATLDDAQLARVAETVTVEEHPPGTRLFSCGEPPLGFYVLEEGSVEIHIPKGSFFGEMGVLRGRSRMADADVVAPSRLLRFDQGAFEALLDEDPAISAEVTRALRARAAQRKETEKENRLASDDPRSFLFVDVGDGEAGSFMVANLAVKVRELTGRPVLVLDLDRRDQVQARLLGGATAGGSLAQAMGDGAPAAEDVRKGAVDLECGVSLLAGAGVGGESGLNALGREDFEKLVHAARSAFDYVLIDAGAGHDPSIDAAARVADTVHVVTSPGTGVGPARDLGDHYRGLGLDARVRFVLGRVPPGAEADVDSMEFELGEEFLGTVEDHGEDGGAGGALVLRKPRSAPARDISRLARTMLSLPQEQGSWFWRVLGLG
jgi:CRP-like cAMP-binding protein